MGVDFLDLQFRLERTFGIRLAAEDLLKYKDGQLHDPTAGELFDSIVTAMQRRPIPGPQLRARLQERIVNLLSFHLTLPAATIDERTPFEQFVPGDRRNDVWSELRRDLSLPLPWLRGLPWQRYLQLAGLLFGVAVGLTGGAWFDPLYWPFVGMAAIAVCLSALLLPLPVSLRFPVGYQSISEMLDSLISQHYSPNTAYRLVWHEDDIWVELREALVAVSGVDAERITRESRLVHDLGME